jgi:hypothetical protein
MTEIGRRGLLKLIGTVPLAGLAPGEAAAVRLAPEAVKAAKAARGRFVPQFFNQHEFATVRTLADMVIPKDERSGSASDAAVPEFMDFMMMDPLETPKERESRQTAMRGGLRWLDAECSERFEKAFLDCSEAERKAVLDDIAWPLKAKPEHRQGAAFFSAFRDLTASGFWSSKIGIEDLKYVGNVYVGEWKGCPPEVLARLGLEDK